MRFKTLFSLASRIDSAQSLNHCFSILSDALRIREFKGNYRKSLKKLISFLLTGENGFTIITKNGNSKLPFYAFSDLPIFNCPGRGECEKWCYSTKSWRYPAAFFRQLQNTILMQWDREKIALAFDKIPQNRVFRLFVDGDFRNKEEVIFWFSLLKAQPDTVAYGYSKSWDELAFVCEFHPDIIPSNYKLNLSSGGKIRNISKEKMLTLPITRGEFIAVPTTVKNKSINRFSLPVYKTEVRENGEKITGKRVFVCPGLCGNCANGAHACGNGNFTGIPIAIGIH